MVLSDVCLTSVAYIGPRSRTERPRKTDIGTEVAHVTRDSDTTFKVKRSKVKVTRPLCSPPCWRVRRLQRSAWNVFGVGKYCYVASARRRATGGGEGRDILCRHEHSLFSSVLLAFLGSLWMFLFV